MADGQARPSWLPAEAPFGWFAYRSPETQDDVPDDPVRDVEIRADEYGGPFWSSDGALGDDFTELQEWIGISRELYDDVMTWHASALRAPDDTAVYRTQQDLLRRLAEEVPPEIMVPAPREEPPTTVFLLSDDVDALPIPAELRARVRAWRAAAAEHGYADGHNDRAIWAWTDAGTQLSHDLSAALGDDYVVHAF